MKSLRSLIGFASMAILILFANDVRAEPTSQFYYEFGVGNAADSLSPSLAFNVRYELADETSLGWHTFNWALWVAGHQAFSEQIRDIDHMEMGTSLFGNFYFGDQTPLPGPAQDYYWQLFQRSALTRGLGLTPAETKELEDLVTDVLNGHESVGYEVAARYVTDQETINKLLTVGLSANAELSAFSKFLDAPFKATRGPGDAFVPEPVQIALGGEYVKGIEGRDDDYPQVVGSLKWSTRMLDKLYPRVKWQASYVSDESTRPDFIHFLDAHVLVPVSATTSVAVGYMLGRQSPNYEFVRGFRIGFDVANW